MIGFEETARFVRIQERLRNATYHELNKEGGGKSSEGALSLTFQLPPVVGDDRAPYWVVEAFSYLLCPDGRTASWTGKTAGEAISKAEDAIERWCFASEMEQFERSIGIEHDPEFDETRPSPRASEAEE